MAALADPSREIGQFIEEHLITFYAFAPVIYMKNTNMACKLYLGQFVFPPFRALMSLLGIYSMNPKTQKNGWLKTQFLELLIWLESKVTTKDAADLEALQSLIRHSIPGYGVSFQQLAHFLQGYSGKGDVKNFKKYDYGRKINLERYGTEEPPRYDLALVKSKIVLYYVESDVFIKSESVEYLKEELSNADVEVVYKEGWNHGTFLAPKDIETFYRNLISGEKSERELHELVSSKRERGDEMENLL